MDAVQLPSGDLVYLFLFAALVDLASGFERGPVIIEHDLAF
jgi:hypothetical protein